MKANQIQDHLPPAFNSPEGLERELWPHPEPPMRTNVGHNLDLRQPLLLVGRVLAGSVVLPEAGRRGQS